MNSLNLPAPHQWLLSHIEPLLSSARTYGIGESVELLASSTDQVNIHLTDKQFKVWFQATDASLLGASDIVVVEASPSLSVNQAQQDVMATPHLVLLGVQAGDGFVDVWHHEGEARAIYFDTNSHKDRQRAMFLSALALDFLLEDAITLARAVVPRETVASLDSYQSDTTEYVSRETWPVNVECFPLPVLAGSELASHINWHSGIHFPSHFAPTDGQKLSLYPVVDSVEWIERLLDMGVTTVQLRMKNPNDPTLEDQIQRAIAAGKRHKAQVYINDYWQLAIKHDAYGVHLGQEDLEIADLTLIADKGLRLGLSTHGYYEILRARKIQPSYIALGHIFPTTTKQMPSKPQGLNRLACYQKLAGDTPTVAIGGIDLSRAQAVWDTGVSSLAVVRAITESHDPKSVIHEFHQIMQQAPSDNLAPSECMEMKGVTDVEHVD